MLDGGTADRPNCLQGGEGKLSFNVPGLAQFDLSTSPVVVIPSGFGDLVRPSPRKLSMILTWLSNDRDGHIFSRLC